MGTVEGKKEQKEDQWGKTKVVGKGALEKRGLGGTWRVAH